MRKENLRILTYLCAICVTKVSLRKGATRATCCHFRHPLKYTEVENERKTKSKPLTSNVTQPTIVDKVQEVQGKREEVEAADRQYDISFGKRYAANLYCGES